MKFLILLKVLLFVEVVISERTDIRIGLVIALAVDIFECMRAQFTLFCFEVRKVDLEVYLTMPGEIAMMPNFVQSIALYISRALEVASKSSISSLLAILVL